MNEIGERIIVVGTSGSGKTTLAKQLAACLAHQHIELDALNWDANWTMAPDFVARVAAATQGEHWVMDGNYSRARSVSWARATTIVWLDYPIWVNYWRITKRTLRRVLFREVLWNGNQESLRDHLFTKDSLYYWIWKTHARRRRDYDRYMADNAFPHLTWIRLTSQREVDSWMQKACQRN